MGKLLGGGALIAVALFMLLGFFNSTSRGVGTSIVLLLLVVGLPGTVGVNLIRSHFASKRGFTQRRDDLRRQTQEAEILALAQEQKGRLTVIEVATRLALPAPTVEDLLSGMHTKGVAELEMTDAGLIVYTFPDILKLPAKGESRDVLDI